MERRAQDRRLAKNEVDKRGRPHVFPRDLLLFHGTPRKVRLRNDLHFFHRYHPHPTQHISRRSGFLLYCSHASSPFSASSPIMVTSGSGTVSIGARRSFPKSLSTIFLSMSKR